MKPPSGKFVLRLPPPLHSELKRRSAALGVSLNDLCKSKLSELLVEAPGSRPMPVEIGEAISALSLPVVAVVLFGSTARGEASADSDVDLLIVVPASVSLSRELYGTWDRELLVKIDRETAKRLSPHFVHLPDSASDAGSLWLEVSLDGLVLWEKELRLSRFLSEVRREIASGRVRRQVSHGHPYWIRDDKNRIGDR